MEQEKTKSRETFKKRYPMTCCVCGKEQYVEPSIFMVGFGTNQGAGNCLKCKEPLSLKIFPDLFGEYMVSEKSG